MVGSAKGNCRLRELLFTTAFNSLVGLLLLDNPVRSSHTFDDFWVLFFSSPSLLFSSPFRFPEVVAKASMWVPEPQMVLSGVLGRGERKYDGGSHMLQ